MKETHSSKEFHYFFNTIYSYFKVPSMKNVNPDTIIMGSGIPEEDEVIIAPVETTSDNTTITSEPNVPTFSEYLSQFRCGDCGKNCLLLNPRCGRRQQKAQQTESEYYALYN